MIKNEILKQKSVNLIPALMTTIFLTFICLTLPIAYYTNDERAIADLLSGIAYGYPTCHTVYVNQVLGFIISRLYMFLPEIPWWGTFHLILISIGMYLSFRSIVCIGYKKQIPIAILIWICVLLEIVLYLPFTSRLAFTVTPAVMSTGIISTFFVMAPCRKRRSEYLRLCMLIGLFCLGYMMRHAVGMIQCCFLFLGIIYYCFSRDDTKGIWKKAGRMFCILLCFLLGIAFVQIGHHLIQQNAVIQGKENSEDNTYDAYRAAFWDYSHISYDENPELFESIGWNKELYVLASDGYFMLDDACDLSVFKKFIKTEVTQIVTVNNKNWLKSAVSYMQSSNRATGYLAIFVLNVFGCILLLRKGTCRLDIFIYFLNIAGSLGLFIFECLHGRVLDRIVIIIFIPMTVISILLLLKNRKRDRKFYVASAILLICGCVLSGWGLQMQYNTVANYELENASKSFRDLYGYAAERLNCIYVYDLSVGNGNNIPAFFNEGKNRAYNLFSWSVSKYDGESKRKANHIKQLNCESFRNENVYYVTKYQRNWPRSMDYWMDYMYRFMRKKYGVVGVEIVDSIENEYMVLHFIFDSVDSDYTGWSKMDTTDSYYKDGKRQTGFFQVNGKTYYAMEHDNFLDVGNGRYLSSYGVLKTGWLNLNGNVYYFNDLGEMQTGRVQIADAVYLFGDDGVQRKVLRVEGRKRE